MKIHELLDSPEKWTQGPKAKNDQGDSVSPTSPNAVCWCLFGAMVKCYGDDIDQFDIAYGRLRRRLRNNPMNWNEAEGRTYSEVFDLVKLLDV